MNPFHYSDDEDDIGHKSTRIEEDNATGARNEFI